MKEAAPIVDQAQALHEGSWAYLGLGHADRALHRDLFDVCAESGWPTVSWSPAPNRNHDPERFFEGMEHAVEHADVVIVLLDDDSSLIDTELALAYRHRRPVIGLSLGGDRPRRSAARAMLRSYGQARVVECEGFGECADRLREALDGHV